MSAQKGSLVDFQGYHQNALSATHLFAGLVSCDEDVVSIKFSEGKVLSSGAQLFDSGRYQPVLWSEVRVDLDIRVANPPLSSRNDSIVLSAPDDARRALAAPQQPSTKLQPGSFAPLHRRPARPAELLQSKADV